MQRDRDVDCITVIRVMSLSISSPSLLPALFNSLHSCLNSLSTTSGFNPAPLTAINLATPSGNTQQLPGRIHLKVPNFTVIHCWTQVLGFGGLCDWDVTWCRFESRTPATKTLHSNFRAEEKKGENGEKGTVARTTFLSSQGNKKAGIFIFKKHQSSAWQNLAGTRPVLAGVNSGWWHFKI